MDFVDSNATAAISPGVPYAGQVSDLIDTNNLGATRMIRFFGRPWYRPCDGRASRLAWRRPALSAGFARAWHG
jgi:hypothetical protein